MIYVHQRRADVSVRVFPDNGGGIQVIPGEPRPPYTHAFQVVGVPPNSRFFLRVRARRPPNLPASQLRLLYRPPDGFGPIISGITPAPGTSGAPTRVQTSFTVCGYVNPTNSTMSSWLTIDGVAGQTNGQSVAVDGYDWGFHYSGLNVGTKYHFFVHATSSGQGSQVDGYYLAQ
jgi:hypothetical protein